MTDGTASRSISFIVTAMNEEGNLAPTVASVSGALSPRGWDYEILIVDDGSTDRTGAIADELAAQDPCIRVHHHPRNLGLHRAYWTGIQLATKEHIGWVAGNNIIPQDALDAILDRMGEADAIFSYPDFDPRRKRRRWISRSFVILLNTLFGVRLRYYTGPCVYRADVARSLRLISHGSMMVPELVIRLIKARQSYIEVDIHPQARTAGRTKTFRLSNIIYVGSSVLRLFVDIQLLGLFRRRPSPGPAGTAIEP
ncbi:MAG: glycosyltransferase family 2 protein [Vicinamibacterales bacterium]|nr:glycosyltransferase family 2 protein [Vicinamibacterales bacterium]